MRTLAFLAPTLLALALVACDSAPPTAAPESVPPGSTSTPALGAATATPDIQATISAGVEATVAAEPRPTATATATPIPTATLEPMATATMRATPTRTSALTPTSTPVTPPAQPAVYDGFEVTVTELPFWVSNGFVDGGWSCDYSFSGYAVRVEIRNTATHDAQFRDYYIRGVVQGEVVRPAWVWCNGTKTLTDEPILSGGAVWSGNVFFDADPPSDPLNPTHPTALRIGDPYGELSENWQVLLHVYNWAEVQYIPPLAQQGQ